MAQCIDRFRSAVAHACTQAANQLMNGISKWTFVRGSSFNAFRNQFFGVFCLLTITVLGAGFHSTNRSHAAIDFILSSLENFGFTRTFLDASEHTAEHDSMSTGSECLNDIAGIFDAAISNDWYTIF